MYLETSFLTNWVTPTQLGWDKYFCSNSLVNSFYTIFHLVCYFQLSNILTSFLKIWHSYLLIFVDIFLSLFGTHWWLNGGGFESFWENKTRVLQPLFFHDMELFLECAFVTFQCIENRSGFASECPTSYPLLFRTMFLSMNSSLTMFSQISCNLALMMVYRQMLWTSPHDPA